MPRRPDRKTGRQEAAGLVSTIMSLFSDMEANPQPEQVWRALADPTRRALLDELAVAPCTTGDLVERFDQLCRTAVMKHLGILAAAGLVVVRREGRRRWNYLNPVPIQQVCERWVNRHVRGIASAMSRLKEHVESTRPS